MHTPLNDKWLFAFGHLSKAVTSPLEEGELVRIPHAPKLFPIQYFDERDYQRECTYQLTFDLADDLPVQLLRLDGVMLQFDAYLNGESLGHFISGYFPVVIDISSLARKKNNLLTLFVDGREDPTIPPFGKVVDYLTFSGIYREVHLESHPEHYIKDVFVHTVAAGRLSIELTVEGEEKAWFEIYDGKTQVASFDTFDYDYQERKAWNLDRPYLYTLVAHYGKDEKRVRFAFRDVYWSTSGFYLNAKRVPLLGLNRHQTFPYFGPAAPKSLQAEDADLLKAYGLNVVRTSHYPQSEHFLDRCDEIGLLVIDEIPGWQYIGKDEKWRENCVDFTRRMIIKERNHPCLIAYGLRIDESGDDDELYGRVQQVKAELDPYRQSLGVRNFKDSHCLEDIYAYNDFSGNSLAHGCDPSKSIKGGEGKPLLISESNGHVFPTKDFDPTERRIEHALRHAKVVSDIFSDPGYCGSISWCAFDYNTHKDFGSDDHICHHGVFDIFRNPKYAASFYKSQGEEPFMEVASLSQPGDHDEALMPQTVVFTNADYVELFRGSSRIATFYPKKKLYPGLAHPPIFVDDYIGATFDEPKFTKTEAKKIVEAINYGAQHGYGRLRIKDKLLLARMMFKYRLPFSYIYETCGKYINSWGEDASIWRYEGYKDGKRIGEIIRGPSTQFHLEVKPSREELVPGDTYDCVSVSIRKLDQFGTLMPYASDPLSLSVTGPIEIYGPRLVSLYGGMTTVYIRNTEKKGASPAEATLIIDTGEEKIETRFLVR